MYRLHPHHQLRRQAPAGASSSSRYGSQAPSKLPASKTETSRPVTAEQEGAILRVVEGDPAMPFDNR